MPAWKTQEEGEGIQASGGQGEGPDPDGGPVGRQEPHLRSVIELDIHVPQARLAALFADPGQSTKWMEDVERMEPVSGQLGMVGSTYRLVPKHGKRVFMVTVTSRDLPAELQLSLEASDVMVSVKGTLVAVSSETTRLTSDEVFHFKGPFGKVMGLLAQGAIKTAHRRHMEAFKRFAESQA
jgi:hypothetical protein